MFIVWGVKGALGVAEKEETEMEISLPDFGKVHKLYQYTDDNVPEDFQRILLARKRSTPSQKCYIIAVCTIRLTKS